MNDRFKFRVWDKINDKWLKATLLDIDTGYLLGYYDNQQAYKRRYILQQCTGLKDKNGKLIYENDIVKFNEEYHWKPKEVIWDEYYYMLKDTQILLCNMEIEQFGLEVIGNIYENPELLEVSE